MIKLSGLLIASVILLAFNSNTALAADKSARKVNSCFGTEPFWDLEITSKVVQFKDSGNNIVMTIPKITPTTAAGTNEDYIAMYQGKTIENPNKYMNVIIVGTSSCSDDMSEEKHPFFALILSGKNLYRRCCD
jgi:uncharacterized membrane protein